MAAGGGSRQRRDRVFRRAEPRRRTGCRARRVGAGVVQAGRSARFRPRWARVCRHRSRLPVGVSLDRFDHLRGHTDLPGVRGIRADRKCLRGRPAAGANVAPCLWDRDRRCDLSVRARRVRRRRQPLPQGDRLRARLRARCSRPAVLWVRPGPTHRDRSRGLDRQRDQRHPLWRREVHVPDGPRRGATQRLGRPIWNRSIGGLLATALGGLLIVNTVNIEGISLMGSAGFLIVFAAVNLASARLTADSPTSQGHRARGRDRLPRFARRAGRVRRHPYPGSVGSTRRPGHHSSHR